MNRLLGLLAFVILAIFLGILLWEVPRFDLGGVILVTLALALADLVRSVREG